MWRPAWSRSRRWRPRTTRSPAAASAPRGSTDVCSVKGGSAAAQNGIQGDSLVNGVVQAPVGGANAANIVCDSILNDNLSGNLLGLDVL